MLKATIRRAIPDDAARLSLLGQATFLANYAGLIEGDDLLAYCAQSHAPAVYEEWLRGTTAFLWLAECDPRPAPVGYLVMDSENATVQLADGDIEIKRVYVLPRFQRLSLGRSLIEEAAGAARDGGFRRLVLGVYTLNEGAIRFYHSIGFERIGRRSFHVGAHFYEDLVLARPLSPRS